MGSGALVEIGRSDIENLQYDLGRPARKCHLANSVQWVPCFEMHEWLMRKYPRFCTAITAKQLIGAPSPNWFEECSLAVAGNARVVQLSQLLLVFA